MADTSPPAGLPDRAGQSATNRVRPDLAAILTEQAAPPETRQTPRKALDLLVCTTDRPLPERRRLVAAELREFARQSFTIATLAASESSPSGQYSAAEGGEVLLHWLAVIQHFIDYAGELVPPTELRPVPDANALTNEILRLAPLARNWAEMIDPAQLPPTPTEPKQGEGEKPPPDQFADLRRFTRDKLKGQERAVMEALCDAGGEVPIADLAVKDGVGWDDPKRGFTNAQRRLKDKLSGQGWRLFRHDNAAKLLAVNARKTR